ILLRCTLPKQAFEELEAALDPTTEGARQTLPNEFQSFSISQSDDPIVCLHEIEVIGTRMFELGTTTTDRTLVHTRYLNALPREYDQIK
ncbi:unnamed protein product, partial [Hapterophycus canaliculatus]